MRNVFKIFKGDLKNLFGNFVALLIILVILVLPALYAWFNVYAFTDPYKNVDKIQIAVVNSDMDYIDDNGNKVNIGGKLCEELAESDHFGYVFLDDADEAVNSVYNGTYYAAVVIEEDFTYSLYNFLTTDIFRPTITFYQNEKLNAIAFKVVEAAADEIKHSVNAKYIDAVVETLFTKLNNFSSDVEGDSTKDMVINALNKIKSNLNGYGDTIDKFITANSSLVGTLKDTNSTLDFAIYLIGNERINIGDQIVYTENIQTDLAKINAEINSMLLSLQDSMLDAIYKIDRLYTHEDEQETVQALTELEQQYRELIDYIENSGLTGSDIDDSLSALNDITTKVTDLRTRLGLDADSQSSGPIPESIVTYNEDTVEYIANEFENRAVPSIYDALTGGSFSELYNGDGGQTLENIIGFMEEDTGNLVDSIAGSITDVSNATTDEERQKALESMRDDSSVLSQELSALGISTDALDSVIGQWGSGKGIDEAAEESRTITEFLDDVLNGRRDLDLNNDMQFVSDALGVVRVALTETVYPALDSLLENLQDSMGDISSMLLDLSGILGKASPILDQLGHTFETVNTALTQTKDVINNYSKRITDLTAKLEDSEDDMIDTVLDFFNVDPEKIGAFLSRPVSMDMRTVYPVKNYGSAMAPFYSMLAIWVGCIIANTIMKQKRCDLPGVTENEVFFGKFLVFFFVSLLQTLVILIGDILILGIQCVHPGLFLLTGVVASLTISMIGYALVAALGNIGKFLFVVILIVQIAGSGGSYPIELLPNFFRQVYMFFPFPYAIAAMRECIAGTYGSVYIVNILKLLLFFAAGLFIGLVLRKSLSGVTHYMDEQLEETELL